MWTKICIAVVPGYELLAKPEQREVKARLRERVRWRLAATAPPSPCNGIKGPWRLIQSQAMAFLTIASSHKETKVSHGQGSCT